jgi:hypothetical protein
MFSKVKKKKKKFNLKVIAFKCGGEPFLVSYYLLGPFPHPCQKNN